VQMEDMVGMGVGYFILRGSWAEAREKWSAGLGRKWNSEKRKGSRSPGPSGRGKITASEERRKQIIARLIRTYKVISHKPSSL
jgi:hypothetical protein